MVRGAKEEAKAERRARKFAGFSDALDNTTKKVKTVVKRPASAKKGSEKKSAAAKDVAEDDDKDKKVPSALDKRIQSLLDDLPAAKDRDSSAPPV